MDWQTAWPGVQGELCSIGRVEIPSSSFCRNRVGRGESGKGEGWEGKGEGRRVRWGGWEGSGELKNIKWWASTSFGLLYWGLIVGRAGIIEKQVSWVLGTKLRLFCELLQFSQNRGTLHNGMALAGTHPQPWHVCVWKSKALLIGNNGHLTSRLKSKGFIYALSIQGWQKMGKCKMLCVSQNACKWCAFKPCCKFLFQGHCYKCKH